RRAARQAWSSASGSPAGERARTTSAARAALAAATARLASVSGCGNWASTVRAPSAPAWTAVRRQWLEPVPPAARNPTSGGARLARKPAGEPLGGAPQPPDPEFYRTLAKALEEIAAGLEQLGKEE